MSIASAITSALETLRIRKAVSITYVRGEDSSDPLSATVGKTDWPMGGTSNVQMAFETRDYLIAASDLVVNSAVVLPQRDDKVRETVGEKVYTYRVLDNDGIPPYRFSDVDKTALRIHTKLFSVADA